MHEGKKKGPTAWVRKAIIEHQKGKTVVLVYPVDKWVLMLVNEIFGVEAEIRNLGDVKWLAIEDASQGKGTGRHIACFILPRQSAKCRRPCRRQCRVAPKPDRRAECGLINKGAKTMKIKDILTDLIGAIAIFGGGYAFLVIGYGLGVVI